MRKAESKHENENISTGESHPGVPGVSRNQKLSKEYDFDSFEVSLEVLTEYTLKNQKFTLKKYQFLYGFSNFIQLELHD